MRRWFTIHQAIFPLNSLVSICRSQCTIYFLLSCGSIGSRMRTNVCASHWDYNIHLFAICQEPKTSWFILLSIFFPLNVVDRSGVARAVANVATITSHERESGIIFIRIFGFGCVFKSVCVCVWTAVFLMDVRLNECVHKFFPLSAHKLLYFFSIRLWIGTMFVRTFTFLSFCAGIHCSVCCSEHWLPIDEIMGL